MSWLRVLQNSTASFSFWTTCYNNSSYSFSRRLDHSRDLWATVIASKSLRCKLSVCCLAGNDDASLSSLFSLWQNLVTKTFMVDLHIFKRLSLPMLSQSRIFRSDVSKSEQTMNFILSISVKAANISILLSFLSLGQKFYTSCGLMQPITWGRCVGSQICIKSSILCSDDIFLMIYSSIFSCSAYRSFVIILSLMSSGSNWFCKPLIKRLIWSVLVTSLAFLFIVEDMSVH